MEYKILILYLLQFSVNAKMNIYPKRAATIPINKYLKNKIK